MKQMNINNLRCLCTQMMKTRVFSLDSEQVVKPKHQTLVNHRDKQTDNKENISKYEHGKQIPKIKPE